MPACSIINKDMYVIPHEGMDMKGVINLWSNVAIDIVKNNYKLVNVSPELSHDLIYFWGYSNFELDPDYINEFEAK